MSEEPSLMSGLWPRVPSGATDWLLELCGDGITGFMPPAMPDAAWVLNAMYEQEQGPEDVSYHEDRQARLAEGSTLPHIVAGIDLDAVGVTTGGGLGRARHPGSGWRRLRWAELARRTGDPAVPDGLMPSHRCFPSAKKEGSWPLGMIPPTEGSLDRETWNRLIASASGLATPRSRPPPSSPDGPSRPATSSAAPTRPGTRCEELYDAQEAGAPTGSGRAAGPSAGNRSARSAPSRVPVRRGPPGRWR